MNVQLVEAWSIDLLIIRQYQFWNENIICNPKK